MLLRSYTPQFYTENKQLIPNSIATIESVMINNRKQTLLMRGQNVEQPILLCCHGGWHGTNRIYSSFSKELEKHFIVINGISAGRVNLFNERFRSKFTIEQFVSDAKEVIQYALKRFNKQNYFSLVILGEVLLGLT